MLLCLLLLSADPASQPRQLQTAERIEFLQTSLDAGTRSAAAWWYGWVIGYSVATVAQGVAAIFITDYQLRANLIVSGASTLLGAVFGLITPLPAVWAAKKMRDAPLDEKLALGERLLRESSQAEQFERSWITHVLCAAVSAAQGFVLWLAFKLPVDAVVNSIASMHIAEAQIFTQPINAIIDWKAYQQRYGQTSATEPTVSMRFTVVPGGLGFAGLF